MKEKQRNKQPYAVIGADLGLIESEAYECRGGTWTVVLARDLGEAMSLAEPKFEEIGEGVISCMAIPLWEIESMLASAKKLQTDSIQSDGKGAE